ncbi:type IV secretion system DNA-binding domain-containing protein [Polaribacter sp. Z022]|uniref:type IV secretory system conjugative DNA transfer family protein n=1 Tax=Polaribacter sp. Z022 TaxID=2927125 RepID=UPI0020226B88|nr:type IV secretion system DNA-binding domain-containing protein [Polaribacter sp. Z022]MCL7752460.1 type IV secretion system DNA-binding domain-containing protein [Polaribacter sp. Z022]
MYWHHSNLYDVSYFARTNFRNNRKIFGIKQADRMFHFYCFGKSGAGKTSLLKSLMMQDAEANRGFAFVDVHGDASREINEKLKDRFLNRTIIYFDVTNSELEFGYNPLRSVSSSKRSLVASNILEIFQRNWKSAWGMKMEHILRMILLTLLDQPKAQLSDILKLLHQKSYREECLIHIQNQDIKTFWTKEFPKYKPNDILPIMNKLGGFLSHSIVRKILIENKKQLSLRSIIDKRHILIINLAKGQVGADVSNILGGLLLTSLASASFSRIDILEKDRVPYFLYIDEFQTISGTELIAELLAQVRKFKVGLILANQFLYQLDPNVRASVLGNVGTIVAFRLGITDAKLMAKEFYPIFKIEDFISLANYSIYLKLMIDGKPSIPFSADTIL